MSDFKFARLSTKKLRSSEFGQLTHSTSTELKENQLPDNSDKVLVTLVNKFHRQVNLYQNSLKVEKTSEEIQRLRSLDKQRDYALQATFDSIKPFRQTPNSEEKEAYDLLKGKFAQFKDIIKASKENQTGLVNQLLGQLNLTRYSQAVRLLGIGRFVTQLQTIQNQYVALTTSQNVAKVNQASTPTASQLRQELEKTYKQLLTYVSIMADLTEKADYIKMFAIMKNIRHYYIDQLNRRQNSRNRQKAKQADADKQASVEA